MKITRAQLDGATLAAVERVNSGGEALVTDDAIEAALRYLGIEVVRPVARRCPKCDVTLFASGKCPDCEQTPAPVFTWVERTWKDVREGDVVRVPGQAGTEGTVLGEPQRLMWHLLPGAEDRATWMDDAVTGKRTKVYQPGDVAEWAGIAVRVQPLDGSEPYHTGHGQNAKTGKEEATGGVPVNVPVEIRIEAGERDAIESMGDSWWTHRVGVVTS